MVQQLSDEDHRRKIHFCLQLRDLISSDDHFLEKMQFSDETTFHVSGAVHRRNVRIWWSENPHAYVEHQRDSPKDNLFCANSSQKVYGPFFAEETVTVMIYLDMLQLWLMPQLQNTPTTNHLVHRRSHSSETEVPRTSTVRFVNTWTQCYQDVGYGVRLERTNHWCYVPRGPLTLLPTVFFFSWGICQRPGIRPTIAIWPRWPKGTDHCSSEEYRCTHDDVCVARTWISYRCVPCHPWCTHRISLVVKK